MQTFLPDVDFSMCARYLDNKRLGKQRVECLQLLNALTNKISRWINHPAAKMWRNFEDALVAYSCEICLEWIQRGFNDSCFGKILTVTDMTYGRVESKDYTLPFWLGNEKLHSSHRSNLLRKNYQHYSQFGWKEPTNLPYWWPV
jgi:hypothetical protein